MVPLPSTLLCILSASCSHPMRNTTARKARVVHRQHPALPPPSIPCARCSVGPGLNGHSDLPFPPRSSPVRKSTAHRRFNFRYARDMASSPIKRYCLGTPAIRQHRARHERRRLRRTCINPSDGTANVHSGNTTEVRAARAKEVKVARATQ
ncbi:hypothetical protein FB45DRAFT_997766, partial [Roridomyces roridus]